METGGAPSRPRVGDARGALSSQYPLALSASEVARYQSMAEQARATEADLWQRAGIVAGAQVADVGCGPGALLPALSDAVAPTGRVAAIDADPEAVAAAGALVAAAGLANVTIGQGRADRTGLPVESFDVVMLRHVLAHNGGSEDVILAHLTTLLRPGGCLYLVDADGTAMRTMPDDVDLADLHQRYLTFHVGSGQRRLRRPLAGRAPGPRGPGGRRVPRRLSDRAGAGRHAPATVGGTRRDGSRWHGDRGGCRALGPRVRSPRCFDNPPDTVRADIRRGRTTSRLRLSRAPATISTKTTLPPRHLHLDAALRSRLA